MNDECNAGRGVKTGRRTSPGQKVSDSSGVHRTPPKFAPPKIKNSQVQAQPKALGFTGLGLGDVGGRISGFFAFFIFYFVGVGWGNLRYQKKKRSKGRKKRKGNSGNVNFIILSKN